MTLTITICCDNAAFDYLAGAELRGILRSIQLESGVTREELGENLNGVHLYDSNGNTVGTVTVQD